MKTSNKILLAVGILLTAFLIYYQIRFQSFKISTSSMYGALFIDDIILIDKHYEAIKTNTIVAFNTSFIDAPVCSRVVGLSNDKVEIKDGTLLINKKPLLNIGEQYEYTITSSVTLNEKQLLKRKTLLEPFILNDGYGNYRAFLTKQNAIKIKNIKGVESVEKVIVPKQIQNEKDEYACFPQHKNYNWSIDNFGEITVPKMGVKIELNQENLPLYIELIKQETQKSDTEIERLKTYTFKQDYYFMMSDNRHNAVDSRYFGFVSKAAIIGVYASTIYTSN